MAVDTALARLDPRLLEPVFERLGERVRAGVVPAAALAIGDADGSIRSAVFSGSDRLRLDEQSIFFLASVTKPIFATAVMQLVEEGRLELHAPVAVHLPEFAGGAKDRVTLWHLLTHTSGVPDTPADMIRSRRPSVQRMTRLAMEAPLNFEPGSRWEYCSASYYLMAEIVRRLTGLDYREFLRQRLFDPMGMATTFDPRSDGKRIVPVKGVGADSRLRRYLLLRYVVAISPPGGGLFGTAGDLLKFGAATLRPRPAERGYLPLAPETIELMGRDHTAGVTGNSEGQERPVHHGLGWHKPTLMDDRPGSAQVVYHGGATGTGLWIDPAANLVFVYLTNEWDPDRSPREEALRGVYEALERG
jgi:serine-type D-Ala-D-Ala carboxypeptidase